MHVDTVKKKDLASTLQALEDTGTSVLMAVVPALWAFFATSPERYEVVEFLVIWTEE